MNLILAEIRWNEVRILAMMLNAIRELNINYYNNNNN